MADEETKDQRPSEGAEAEKTRGRRRPTSRSRRKRAKAGAPRREGGGRKAARREARGAGHAAAAARISTRSCASKLTEQFGYKNRMQVPVIEKVVINMGIGEGVNDRKKVEQAAADLGADRRPEGRHHQVAQVDRHLQAARRPGHRLQGDAAQDADVRVHRPADQHRAAARARLPRAQSRRASTAAATTRMGIKEHIIFPEIDYDKAADIWGMDITVCTSARPTTRRARC